MSALIFTKNKKTNGVRNHPFTTMTLDIIYPIVLTPIVFAVGYGLHCIKKAMNKELPEAKPYQFERDEYKPEFDQFSQAIFNHKFYKGKAK